ncbi:MAG: tetratricopeptide repeat protein, partial [Candidatus Freyarchaeota archaeon]
TSNDTALQQSVQLWDTLLSHPQFSGIPGRLQSALWNGAGGTYMRSYWRRGVRADLERAISLFSQALQGTPPDSPDRPSLLNNLATALRSRYARDGLPQDLEEAITTYRQALQVTPPDSPDRPSLLNNLVTAISAHYEFSRQSSNLQEYLHKVEQKNENDLDEIINLYEELIEIQENKQEKDNQKDSQLINFRHNLSIYKIEKGEYYEGLELLEKCLDILRTGDDLETHAKVVYQIARAHHLLGNLDEARVSYRDAYRIFETTKNWEGMAACKRGLGRLMIKNGRCDLALEHLSEAEKIYQQLGDQNKLEQLNREIQTVRSILEREKI